MLWTGTYNVGQKATGAISLILQHKDANVDTLVVNSGVAGW